MTISRRHPSWIVFAAALALAASWADHGRADVPSDRYTIDNGTVFDKKTLLTWQQTISPITYTWAAAQTHCTELNLNGMVWRVPSVKELQTIVDEKEQNPAIDPTAFPNTPVDFFWTSSRLAGSTSYAWPVVFHLGTTDIVAVANMYRVRCVR